jgi:hypothetical protein
VIPVERTTRRGYTCYSHPVSFDWMIPAAHRDPAREADRRIEMVRRAASERAGLFYRLGYSEAEATRRIAAYLDWDFELGAGGRPAALNDAAVRKLVKATYARRPSR